jgi:hypothetical protein
MADRAGRGSAGLRPSLLAFHWEGGSKGGKGMFRRRDQQEEAQEKGSQEPKPGALDGPYDDVNAQPTWHEGAIKCA